MKGAKESSAGARRGGDRPSFAVRWFAAWAALSGGGACTVFDEELPACTSNLECTLAASADSDTEVPAVCAGRDVDRACQPLLGGTCYKVTAGTGQAGDANDAYKDDRAIFIGSLFETGGPDGMGSNGQTNQRREESAILAVHEINTVGGIPGTALDEPRPLVMISCDSSTNLLGPGGGAEHLIDRIQVPGIVGPNQSQDVLDLNPYSAPRRTVLLSPTGVASSIADAADDGFTYQMVPNDLQRAPLMNDQINALEASIRATLPAGEEPVVRLAVLFRNDALGQGTQRALNSLTLNGAPLARAPNRNGAAWVKGYEAADPSDDDATLAALLDHRPHIVVLAGNQEVITRFISGAAADPPTEKLEERWDRANPGVARPYYIGIDSTKNAALFGAARNSAAGNDFRRRVRGTGVTPGPESQSVFDQFTNQYLIEYPGNTANVSGMGSSYDAVYALALAMAASDAGRAGQPITGDSVKEGLRLLSGGAPVPIEQSTLAGAFRELADGRPIDVVGTFGPMTWNSSGAKSGGFLEVWCLRAAADEDAPAEAESTGRQYDVETDTFNGSFDADARCP